jgi:hypothetical protein
MSDHLEEMGPVDYLVVEFPEGSLSGTGLMLLMDLVDRRIIRILDMQFIRRRPDGSVAVLDIEELHDPDLAVFHGASAALLDADDLAQAASHLEPGAAAVVLIYENLWAAPLATALRRNGARLVGSGQISMESLWAALVAMEAAAQPVSSTGRGE